ncbi:signal recognition particle-docking protein FtsY [Acinetobacter calcoaceticus]|uniref:Signal recognition particle receptor FtsY n=1 Tax=Acinetobacter calcoaceticus TaxID=471 RepID=A0A4R1XN25_ACICA|nr:signal recognition particle-docking protein FtsY [Acinetobacter calcoaceticus]
MLNSAFYRGAFQGIGMQQQQNKFLIDADIGDDDVTLPSLPAVNVPIIENHQPETEGSSTATAQQTAAVAADQTAPQPSSDTAASPSTASDSDDAEKGGFFSRMKAGLTKTRKNLADGMVSILIGGKEIDDELLEEVEEQLLVADIGVEATKTIIANLTERTARGDLIYSHSLYKALQEELVALLAPRVKALHIDPNKRPFVILVVGVNGVGKTTTIGKLAKRLQGEGKKVMLAAGDTFRAAATEQLEIWGERNQISVVSQGNGADSASVIFDAFESARAKGIDVLIADTAGRLHNKSNLMEELKKVKRVMQKIDATAPHEIMLVVDAGTGQNAVNQVELFDEAVGLTGLTITKLDGTAKGGVLFNIASRTHVPIRFIGVGEKIDDLRPFSAKAFVAALFETEK